MAINVDFSDFEWLAYCLKDLERLPQKSVTKAARKGGSLVMKAVKQKAPVDTGNLKRGIKLKPEKSRLKGKKVYDIVFDAGMNDIFQKPIKNPGAAGGKNKTAYYPASMEYGYFARNGRYIPGFHFMRKAAEEMEGTAEKEMADVLVRSLRDTWLKKFNRSDFQPDDDDNE